MNIEIPKYDHTKGDYEEQAPCWVPIQQSINNKEWYAAKQGGIEIEQIFEYVKPSIVCKCGKITGIGLHHVHADGVVTASYYHKRGDVYPEDPNGCEWHVFLKLIDYNLGEFPPNK